MKRILITAVRYPPCETIGAKRPYKMANFLSSIGWDVTVLTVDSALTPPLGPDTAANEKVKIIRTKAFVPYVMLQNRSANRQEGSSKVLQESKQVEGGGGGLVRSIKSVRNYVAARFLTALDQIDEWSGWKRPALKAVRGLNLEFDVVLSTIPPYSTAFLGKELAEYYECKFVLDYRDPWSEILRLKRSVGDCSARQLKRSIKFEEDCLNAADLILTVSPGITEMLGKRVRTKILTVPQGFTGKVSLNSYDKESKYLLYAGNLSYGRDLSCILQATRILAETYHENLRLIYCGMHSDLAYEQASSVGAAEFIEIVGSVPEYEVLEYAKRSVCNLVIVSPGYEYSYPGKLFDLMPAGRPIYVISELESEAGKLVQNIEIGNSIVGPIVTDLADRFRAELSAEFKISSDVTDLAVNNIYTKMVNEGLNVL